MNQTQITRSAQSSESVLDRLFIGLLAIICGIILAYLSIMGPLGFSILEHHTSPSAIYQTIGQDLANLIVLVPLLIIGGITHIMQKPCSKYLLILTPIYLLYMAISYTIGQEWNRAEYTGNIEQYFYHFLILIIGGLILLIYTLSNFDFNESPDFNPKSLRIYTFIFCLALTFFAIMWIGEVNEVLRTGDTVSNSYSSAPTVFWVIRIFDLGISIPLGFISAFLLLRNVKKFYPLILLSYGFFITMITAVNCMGFVMLANNDPELQAGGLVIFLIMAILAYSGFFFLIKDKINKKIE
ncbi:hypothetical protein [Candidatus Lokiarchaeum ossiferum]|uniref:hypothetical protein n=1 Tax=Candidatus Lokiarchaeum ossiferum TaxID=2951803 RepID=UPI00352DCBE1